MADSDATGPDAGARPGLERRGAGLCPGCAHVHPVCSPRGSVFLRCRLSAVDERYPKYPPQPVVRCAGHEPA